MRCLLLLLTTLLAAAASVSACAPGAGPTDQNPLPPGPTTARGFHGIGFHGIGLDVPDTAVLTQLPSCGSLPPTGDLVVVVFSGGASSCPTTSAAPTPPSPRPATDLTIVLTETGVEPLVPRRLPRYQVVTTPRVTVAASGPGATVDAVLSSIRLTEQGPDGCHNQIDPNVAPRNIKAPGGTVLPVPTDRVVVCEYGITGGEGSSAYWLVGSRELTDDEADDVVAGIDAAPVAEPHLPAAVVPVLRLLVLGDDGNTRTLQALTQTDPQLVTDGTTTVTVGPVVGGDVRPLPTPFDGI